MPKNLLVFLLPTLLAVGCSFQQGASIKRPVDGQGTLGNKDRDAFSFNNGRVRCHFIDHRTNAFDLNCAAVVISADGNETKAKSIADGVSLFWQLPLKIARSEVTGMHCRVDASNLNQHCSFSLVGNLPTKLQTDLKVVERSSGQERVESDTVLLPLTVEIFGRSTEFPRKYEIPKDPPVTESTVVHSGFQNQSFYPTKEDFGRISTVAGCGNRIYFGYRSFIYLIELDKPEPNTTLFAGSNNYSNRYEFSHRLRVTLGKTHSFTITCGRNPKEIYVADTYGNRILRISEEGPVQVIADSLMLSGTTVDRVYETNAQAVDPRGLVLSPNGEIFFSDTSNNRIRKVSSTGTIVNIAGNGQRGFSGDGGMALSAQLSSPRGLAFLSDGSLLFADSLNHRIRKVTPDGKISTFAGNGVAGVVDVPASWFSGDGDLAIAAQLYKPMDVAIATDGSVFIADFGNNRVRKVSTDGHISTYGGTGAYTNMGDLNIDSTGRVINEGLAVNASYSGPSSLALGADGTLFLAANASYLLRGITKLGISIRIAGKGVTIFEGDGGSAIDSLFGKPTGLGFRADGSLMVGDWGNFRIRKIGSNSVITTIAGKPQTGSLEEGAPASLSQIGRPIDLMTAPDGSMVFIADYSNGTNQIHKVKKITADGSLITIAGNGVEGYSGDGGPALEAQFNRPESIALHPDGSILIADTRNHRIRKIAPNGMITTIAGNGQLGVLNRPETWFSGDGGPATQAQLYSPSGVVVSGNGTIFVSDTDNHRVRKITPDGIISTIAGNGTIQPSDEKGLALQRGLWRPTRLVFDSDDRLYVVDSGNHRIRIMERSSVSLDGDYTIETLLGAPSDGQDCGGGIIRKDIPISESMRELKASVLIACFSNPTSIAFQNRCGDSSIPVSERGLFMAIGQHSITTTRGNIILAKRPCIP